MSEFAQYTPMRPRGVEPAVQVQISEACVGDLKPIADLTATREGGTAEEYYEPIARQLEGSPRVCQLFVARLDSDPVVRSESVS